MAEPRKRDRMMFDLPQEIQLAIRLRALKDGVKTASVVEKAIKDTFPDDVAQAFEIIVGQQQEETTI